MVEIGSGIGVYICEEQSRDNLEKRICGKISLVAVYFKDLSDLMITFLQLYMLNHMLRYFTIRDQFLLFILFRFCVILNHMLRFYDKGSIFNIHIVQILCNF